MVFQNFALMPHLSVFENIAFPLRIRRVSSSEIKDKVMEALELIRLPGIADRKPKQLSGGQQQRVAIARALVYKPPVILMDEPLGALDRKLRQQMQFEIKRIHDGLGLSMIYVTHDQEEALTMSDRICLMGAGKIQDAGPPRQIYSRPSTEFSADFFGATNIFKGVVSRSSGRCGLQHSEFGFIRSDAISAQDRTEHGWMVRPEQLRFLAEGEVADNAVAGIVADVILLGQVTNYIITTDSNHKFSVARLTGDTFDGPVEGEHVRVGWSAGATMVLRPAE
jgi:putative spermidine/putrescine transport system ATP-binding protein